MEVQKRPSNPFCFSEISGDHDVYHRDFNWTSHPWQNTPVLADAAREILIRQTLHELAGPLTRAQVHPLVLGGVALWAREYSQVGQRRVYDLDLWIAPKEFEKFSQVLVEQNFIQSPRYHMLWHRGAVEIDLHTHPINDERGAAFDCLFTFDAQDIWSRGKPLPCCPRAPWRRPCLEDLWIQLTLHAIKHEFERLNLAIDLHLLLQQHQPTSQLGQSLWAVVSPVLKELQLDTPLSCQSPPRLAYQLIKPRFQKRFLVGLRLLASLGESPWKFWWTLAWGNQGVRRESGIWHRWKRLLQRFKVLRKKR